jgi:glycosyltransferase involved in cell wall biosynthesis
LARYRFLIVNHAVEMGGAERVLLRLLDRMDRELFEPALACPHEGPLVKEMRNRNITVYLGYPASRLLEVKRRSVGKDWKKVLAYPYDMALTVLRLARLIRREGFDLVFTNSAKGDIYGSLAGWLARKPVVWRLHDIVTAEAFSRLNIWFFSTFASLFACKVLAVSGAVKNALVDQGVSKDKVRVVYNGIDLEDIARRVAEEDIRAEWDVTAGAPLAGMVGRLVDWKGPDYFIKAAAEVAKEVPEASFMLVGAAIFGDESFVEGLKSMVSRLDLEERVIFTGFRGDVSEIMGSMDLLVHASILPDPLPTVLIEAMAQGKPVVAAAGGGVKEIVEDGATGIIVPPRDVEAMARAMIKMLSHPDQARGMGEAGLRRAASLFDIVKTTRQMETELLEILSGGR